MRKLVHSRGVLVLLVLDIVTSRIPSEPVDSLDRIGDLSPQQNMTRFHAVFRRGMLKPVQVFECM